MRVELTKRLSLIKATLAVVLGIYLATLSFTFGYLLWQSITLHLADATTQIVLLAVIAFSATAWGGYVASWFNYYRNGRLLGLFVGASLYLASAVFLATAPEDFVYVLPFAKGHDTFAGLQAAIPPLVAGALGGWIAERLHRRRLRGNELP